MLSRPALLLAFAFAVMADPASSVAYAIEAALHALNADLALLVPTMAMVVAIIALVIVNYRQLIARYPQGGGASAAVGEAFGDGWSFIPIGTLIVDFVLTIAISVSAGVLSSLVGISPDAMSPSASRVKGHGMFAQAVARPPSGRICSVWSDGTNGDGAASTSASSTSPPRSRPLGCRRSRDSRTCL